MLIIKVMYFYCLKKKNFKYENIGYIRMYIDGIILNMRL